MRIVSDGCGDVFPGQLDGLNVTIVPLTFTLDGKTYKGGVDIDTDGFYRLIQSTESFPTTSQPSVGDFVEVYREVAKADRDILSVHVSSALSGTYNSATAGAQLVPEANITVYDSKVVSSSLGWMMEAAGRCAQAGWSKEQTIAQLEKIRCSCDFVFSVPNLRYLIHGGRISHLKGLLATALGIKPLIGLDVEKGSLTQAGQARTTKAAYQGIITHMAKHATPGTALRVQVLHGDNPEGAEAVKALVSEHYDCCWMPTVALTAVLGAHTGPGLVGAFYAPISAFDGIPGRFAGAT